MASPALEQSLTDTVAFVTGATSGIGEAVVRLVWSRGGSVVAVGRRLDRLDRLSGEFGSDRLVTIGADLTRSEEAAGAVESAVEGFGRLDIVVNSAGVMLNGPSLTARLDEWETMVDLNLKGLMYVTKAALPHLVTAARGHRHVSDLVNISSIAGRFANRTVAIYNATKLGVTAASEAWRQEFSPHGVRVSVVEPGMVATELFGHQQQPVQEHYERMFSGVEPLRPSDIADIVAYIVTAPRRMALAEVVVRPTDQV
jgi:NADP-dependent 3-hydroxy acid dehydrogenase YdfG